MVYCNFGRLTLTVCSGLGSFLGLERSAMELDFVTRVTHGFKFSVFFCKKTGKMGSVAHTLVRELMRHFAFRSNDFVLRCTFSRGPI
jgi:hypothetical protein